MLQKRSLENHTYINTTNEEILAVQKAEMTVGYNNKTKTTQNMGKVQRMGIINI